MIVLFLNTVLVLSCLLWFATLYLHLPTDTLKVDSGGTIIVTNAGSGMGREIAIRLADRGSHVLACVSNDAELRSFLYENCKGLEAVVFNINDPADIPKLLYRSKEIERDLGRELAGVVINNADNSTIAMKRVGKKLETELSVHSVDGAYRGTVKSSLRLIDAAIDLFGKKKNNEGGRIVFLQSVSFVTSLLWSRFVKTGQLLICIRSDHIIGLL